ncbi:VOC family protein [uncultured Croceitalea sp.]|uniref:VOC family protein n=1 Tax=uncultured Croceitalea sp. TaxID=1798908 RepID=UPI00374E6DB8
MEQKKETTRSILRRATFVVPDAEVAAQFYIDVFQWKVWYDDIVHCDERFPPSGAPHLAETRVIILESADPALGKLGFIHYTDAPFDTGLVTKRTKIRVGEPLVVINTTDIDDIYNKAIAAGATVVTTPANWTVPGADGKKIQLRSSSMFDPSGIYLEISQSEFYK